MKREREDSGVMRQRKLCGKSYANTLQVVVDVSSDTDPSYDLTDAFLPYRIPFQHWEEF